jgi:PAS domain S-box-containing protein
MDGGGVSVPDDISEALRESEERYRTLFEQAPVGVFLYDLDLRLRDFNRRFVQILHSTPDKLRRLDMKTLRDQRILPTLERALHGESVVYEGPYEASTGAAQLHVALHIAPLRDASGIVVGALGIAEDVTDRARAASALQDSEQRLALHVRRSPLGVVGFDPEGRIVEWNAAASRIFGWSEAEALGRDAIELLVPPWARREVTDVFRALLARRGGERSINENATKDGRVILCDWYNTALVDDAEKVIGVASVIDDITDRHQAERALRKSEVRFRALIENAPDALAVYPPDDRRLVYVNPAFATMLGYEAPQVLLGHPIDDHVHPEDRAILDRRWARLVEARGKLPPQEYRMLRQDGKVVVAEFVSMIIDYDERPHVIAFGRDVTDQRQMQARLLQADRMVSVGTLAAGVAHEINNPLAYAMTSLDSIALRKLPPLLARLRDLGGEAAAVADQLAQTAAMVDVAREGCSRMRDIVRDLLTFTRSADEDRRGPVDVRRVLDASINVAWNEIRHRARLVKEYGEVPAVVANEARLGQVFLNLLVNAAQALHVGDAAENVIRVVTATDGDGRVVVEVHDSGPGISSEHMARIFDPFFTTKPVGVGTGLGLWICQGIVSSLGGHISADNAPAGGAVFRVVLPAAAGTAGIVGPAAAVPAATSRSPRLRLLVVDDESAIGRTLAIGLADDFDVTAATTGREALELLTTEDRFDVVLCDLMMPEISGMEVYERVVERTPAMASRFVFVTGGAFTERARKFVERVGAPVLEKPFELTALSPLLRGLAASAK